MVDHGASPFLMEIAAARVLHWNVDFDRGLRSNKAGGQCEAVMKLGPQLVRWGHDGEVTASSANLFKLDPGQDRVFASVILLRLADTFRSGNNFVRVCILKALLLEFKSRKWAGEGFPEESFERRSFTRKTFSTYGAHLRGRRRKPWTEEAGLLTKRRIENYGEVLRRVKSVAESGDPTSRSLAIRVLGCLADLGKDSSDVHSLILQALESPYLQEVGAAVFAMGCLSELSDDFAETSLQAAYEMINAMETPSRVKTLAARLFAKVARSPLLSVQALEKDSCDREFDAFELIMSQMGRNTLLRYPTPELIVAMLTSLTILASESTVIIIRQVDLLLMYIAHDPRMHVRAVALKCLSRLIPQVFCYKNSAEDIFNAVFAAVQDTGLPEILHELALRVIKKLCHQLVATVGANDLIPIISWVELMAMRGGWAVKSQALALLVAMVSDLMKSKLENEPQQNKANFTELSFRVCLLLCDQLAIVGAETGGPEKVTLGSNDIHPSSVPIESNSIGSVGQRASIICALLVKFVRSNAFLAETTLSSITCIIEAIAKRDSLNKLGSHHIEIEPCCKSRLNSELGAMIVDFPPKEERMESTNVRENSEAVRVISSRQKQSTSREMEFLLKGLERTLSAIVYSIGYDGKIIEKCYERLRSLSLALIATDCPASALCIVSEALMKVKLLLNAATSGTRESGKDASTSRPRLDVNDAILQCGRQIVQKRNFWTAYQLGKQGATSGSWSVAELVFDGLVDQVSSEGCYFWLKALLYQAKAECALLYGSSKDESQENHSGPQAEESLETPGVDGDMDFDEKDAFSSQALKNFRVHQAQVMDSPALGRLRSSARQAIGLLQIALNSLAAGVCSERMFAFQREVLILRVEFLETISELVGVFTQINSLDTEVGNANAEAGEMSDDLKGTWSALQASTSKAQLKAFQLQYLGKKYDSLSISMMGIDQESVKSLSRVSLLCSLLTFCILCALPLQPTSALLVVNPALSAGGAALDLYNRLIQFEQEGLDEILSFAMQNGGGSRGRTFCGSTIEKGPQEFALVHLCKSAVTGVLGLHTNNKLKGIMRGAALLHKILEACLNLPWLSPPFFFCTRPRPGVDLFLAQVGPSDGAEAEKLSVLQGSTLALSVCLQIANASQELLLDCKRLICAFSVQQVDTVAKADDHLQLGSGAGLSAEEPSLPSILERLRLHSDATSSTSGMSVPLGNARHGPEEEDLGHTTLFVIPLGSKGQGFGSCTIDVSQLPRGDHQLMLYCICEDRDRRHWNLPLLSPRPTFWVT